MTEPQVFLAALTDAERAEVTAHIALGKTNLAISTLQQVEPRPAPRTIAESLVELAVRGGIELVCPMCGEGPAAVRDDYLHLPLCDHCSLKYMTWPCPDCAKYRHGVRADEGLPCTACATTREWAALAEQTRDEIDLAVAEQNAVQALMRIRDLTSRGVKEAMELYNLRRENRDATR